MEYREISRDEIQLLKEIDRSEIIEKIYYFRDGQLALEEEYHEVTYDFWVKHADNKIIPNLNEIHDSGGTIFGVFDNAKIVGMTALDTEFIGKNNDQLNVPILFVDKEYHKRGIARKLMELVADKARQMGARKLYVSATPSESTVNFYLGIGCKVTDDVNKEMFEDEPEDIHMEMEL